MSNPNDPNQVRSRSVSPSARRVEATSPSSSSEDHTDAELLAKKCALLRLAVSEGYERSGYVPMDSQAQLGDLEDFTN